MVTVFGIASFTYYLISYQLKYLKGDFFVNGLVSGGSEILGYLTSGTITSWFGIKPTFIISYVLAIAGMVCLILVNTDN